MDLHDWGAAAGKFIRDGLTDPIFAALLIALLVPWLVLVARHEVRIRRLRQIEDFFRIFADGTAGQNGGSGLATNPSFEFARSKYTADLEFDAATKEELRKLRTKAAAGGEEAAALTEAEKQSAENEIYIRVAERRSLSKDRRLIIAFVGFSVYCFYGFWLLFGTVPAYVEKLVVSNQPPIAYDEQFQVVLAIAFVGSFISTMRQIVARLSVFDLSPTGILHMTAESLASVFISGALYVAFPDPFTAVGAKLTGSTTALPQQIPWVWLVLPMVFGLMPNSSTKFLLTRLQSLSRIKTTDDRFETVTRITSLDVIDGIDFSTRFRLEEIGVVDVQNLATYNPILMNIETPYGIYQCIDWIAQAQLCHIVGLERFLLLRELSIRTIFDLERAIDSKYSPDSFDSIYLSVLIAPTQQLRDVSNIGATKLMIVEGNGEPSLVGVEEYLKWVRNRLGKDDSAVTRAVEYLMTWIADDLHIKRLRRLWLDISGRLGEEADSFPDSKRRLQEQMDKGLQTLCCKQEGSGCGETAEGSNNKSDGTQGKEREPPAVTITAETPNPAVVPEGQAAPADAVAATADTETSAPHAGQTEAETPAKGEPAATPESLESGDADGDAKPRGVGIP